MHTFIPHLSGDGDRFSCPGIQIGHVKPDILQLILIRRLIFFRLIARGRRQLRIING